MADINLINVNKVYPPDVKAVEEVNLHINDGEFMALERMLEEAARPAISAAASVRATPSTGG